MRWTIVGDKIDVEYDVGTNTAALPSVNALFHSIVSTHSVWENLHGLWEACLQRCVPGVTNKDGKDAYDPRDIVAIPSMSTKACEAWLNERTEGAYIALVFSSTYSYQFHRFFVLPLHYLHARWVYSLKQSCCRGTQYPEATTTY